MCAIAAGRFCESQEQLAEAQRMANVGSWEVDFATGYAKFGQRRLADFPLPSIGNQSGAPS